MVSLNTIGYVSAFRTWGACGMAQQRACVVVQQPVFWEGCQIKLSDGVCISSLCDSQDIVPLITLFSIRSSLLMSISSTSYGHDCTASSHVVLSHSHHSSLPTVYPDSHNRRSEYESSIIHHPSSAFSAALVPHPSCFTIAAIHLHPDPAYVGLSHLSCCD
jgi:hypothetical protein